jgi:hypothetical protein
MSVYVHLSLLRQPGRHSWSHPGASGEGDFRARDRPHPISCPSTIPGHTTSQHRADHARHSHLASGSRRRAARWDRGVLPSGRGCAGGTPVCRFGLESLACDWTASISSPPRSQEASINEVPPTHRASRPRRALAAHPRRGVDHAGQLLVQRHPPQTRCSSRYLR